MPETDLLKLKNFGKSSISSVIGTIYYVWHIDTEDSGAGLNNRISLNNDTNLNSQANPDSYVNLDNASNLSNNTNLKTCNYGKTIFFLSNSLKSFDFFINFLRNKFPHYYIIDISSPKIEKELAGYLSGKTREINLEPAYLYGTDFEKKIWETTRKIPYGDVASYKELAERAGYPNAFRAAGTA